MSFGKALMGMGAGFSGRGAEWARLQQQEQLMQQQKQEQDALRQKQAQMERLKAHAQDTRSLRMLLEKNEPQAAQRFLQNRISYIKEQGQDPSHSMQALEALQSGNTQLVLEDLRNAELYAVNNGLLPDLKPEDVQVQSSEILSDGTVVSVLKSGDTRVTDPNGKVLEGDARTKAIRAAREYGAITQGDRATQREIGKLQAQFKLSPKVKSAVEEAVLAARDKSAVSTDDRSNERAFEVYQAATNGLIRSFEDTTTGPFAGFLPAITSSQQIADGAVAAMAPTLKQLFRSAGEGTFTDSDQRILMQMIPTRSDRPDSVRAKLANIDTIVKAKLGISERQEPQPAAPVVQSPPTPQKNMKWSELE